MEIAQTAAVNFGRLADNLYPGRGLILGLSKDKRKGIIVYFLTGRSKGSRERVLKVEGGRVYTETLDGQVPSNAELTIYNAMSEAVYADYRGSYVVSNGRQTDAIAKSYAKAGGLAHLMTDMAEGESISYEPDDNSTPRIAGALSYFGPGPIITLPTFSFGIWKKSPINAECERMVYFYHRITPGYGCCIHTYKGDGDPLPNFEGEPTLVPLASTAEEILKQYWGILNEDNRVSIAVKEIELGSGEDQVLIINKYQQINPVSAQM